MVMERSDVKALVRKIEELLNTEVTILPGRAKRREPEAASGDEHDPNPPIGGRIMYVPLPGTGRRFQLSPRAQQVFSFLTRNRKASPKALQVALKVNRNVIAGAVHELKAKHAIRTESVGPSGRRLVETAAEHAPRKRRKRSRRKT